MRAGACTAQQTLSAEAASVLKLSLTLARRRGHAQVTPLHVAATLLTSRSTLLRRACLKSHPHQPSYPLHSRALDLCFNVALNRLPTAPGPLLHAQPSLSNALVAALKRAQAHQRRGCIEQQQQQSQPPLIAIKVELEQLILSILDDPSVSRVMREAGFSSTAVKNNLEDSNIVFYNTSGGIFSTPNSPRREVLNPTTFWHSHLLTNASDQKKIPLPQHFLKDDIKEVIKILAGKKKYNTVIVGDSSSMAETLVAELLLKLEKGDVPDELNSTRLIKFQFSSVPLMFMNKEEVDMNVADLKRKVESVASGGTGRVIIYIGDLKWAVHQRESTSVYNPIHHLIAEIAKLLCYYNNSSMIKVWIMATANYQTYIKCQMKQPPLDVQWGLQAVSVPSSGGLGLSLNAATSGRENSRTTFSENSSPVTEKKLFCLEEGVDGLNCCPECMSNFEKEAASPQLPYWLNSHAHGGLEKEDLDQLKRKYNKLCQNLHHSRNDHYLSSSYPFWPNKTNILSDSETISFVHPAVRPNQGPSSVPRFRRQQSCHIEFSFSNESGNNKPNLDCLKGMEEKEGKITLALGSCMYGDAQSVEKSAVDADMHRVFKENVPWQSDSIPLIIEALKEDNVVLMQGNDTIGKRRLAVAIAESMFGSSELLFHLNMRKSGDSVSEHRWMVERALRKHEKLVVLVEDVDCADPQFVKFLCDGFEGRSDSSSAVFVLTTGGDTSYYGTRGETNSVIQMRLVDESTLGSEAPNLDHKRKAEWDPMPRSKSRRSNEMEEVSSIGVMNQIKEFKRQLSSNVLDLNIKADEDEAKEGEPGDLSPISSDLTRETSVEEHNSLGFLKKIKNRIVFNVSSDQERQAKGMFLSRLRRSFQEVNWCTNISNFNVDERVLDEVLRGAGWYLNSLFEEWLKDVFQMCLGGVNRVETETERVSFRLCLVGKEECCAKDGFKGTCLPIMIPVSFIG